MSATFSSDSASKIQNLDSNSKPRIYEQNRKLKFMEKTDDPELTQKTYGKTNGKFR